MPLSELGQTRLIYALRIVGFIIGGTITALGLYVLITGRDTGHLSSGSGATPQSQRCRSATALLAVADAALCPLPCALPLR